MKMFLFLISKKKREVNSDMNTLKSTDYNIMSTKPMRGGGFMFYLPYQFLFF